MSPRFKCPLEFWLGSIPNPCSDHRPGSGSLLTLLIPLTILPLLFPVHTIPYFPVAQQPSFPESLHTQPVPPPSTPPRKDRLAHPWPLQDHPFQMTIYLPPYSCSALALDLSTIDHYPQPNMLASFLFIAHSAWLALWGQKPHMFCH